MPTPDLITICISAFSAVFALLCVLAVIQRLILVIFPENKKTTDAMLYASVAAVYQSLYPGSRISKVEELK